MSGLCRWITFVPERPSVKVWEKYFLNQCSFSVIYIFLPLMLLFWHSGLLKANKRKRLLFEPGLTCCGGDSDVCVTSRCPVGYQCGRTGFPHCIALEWTCINALFGHHSADKCAIIILFVCDLPAPTRKCLLRELNFKKRRQPFDTAPTLTKWVLNERKNY